MGNIAFLSGSPKIIRNHKGWLAAAAGEVCYGMTFEKWFKDGMLEKRPEIDSDKFSALLMSPDGQVWRTENNLILYRVVEPAACGEESAEAYVFGAIDAGATPERAMEMACERCVYVRGPVQVERLG